MKKPKNPVLEDLKKGKLPPVQKTKTAKTRAGSQNVRSGLFSSLKYMTVYDSGHSGKKGE